MTVKAGKFDICTECGAHLDPGEKCDCEEERQQQDKQEAVEQKKE